MIQHSASILFKLQFINLFLQRDTLPVTSVKSPIQCVDRYYIVACVRARVFMRSRGWAVHGQTNGDRKPTHIDHKCADLFMDLATFLPIIIK